VGVVEPVEEGMALLVVLKTAVELIPEGVRKASDFSAARGSVWIVHIF